MKRFLPFIALFLLAGCAITDRQAEDLRKRSILSGSCALHHEPLISTNAFGYTSDIFFHPTEDYLQLDRDYPNAVIFPYSTENSEFFTKPTNYRYCRKCQIDHTKKAAVLWEKEA